MNRLLTAMALASTVLALACGQASTPTPELLEPTQKIALTIPPTGTQSSGTLDIDNRAADLEHLRTLHTAIPPVLGELLTLAQMCPPEWADNYPSLDPRGTTGTEIGEWAARAGRVLEDDPDEVDATELLVLVVEGGTITSILQNLKSILQNCDRETEDLPTLPPPEFAQNSLPKH